MATPARGDARHIRRLAHAGAGRAAAAFAGFLRRDLRAREPSLCAASGAATAGRGEMGVVFEVEGAVHGLMALLLPLRGRDSILSALCPGAGPGDERARSALREAGNIVASHAVSAMADHLGARITLSVPTLLEDAADVGFGRLLDERRGRAAGVAAQTELVGPRGERQALLVFAPDAADPVF